MVTVIGAMLKRIALTLCSKSLIPITATPYTFLRFFRSPQLSNLKIFRAAPEVINSIQEHTMVGYNGIHPS